MPATTAPALALAALALALAATLALTALTLTALALTTLTPGRLSRRRAVGRTCRAAGTAAERRGHAAAGTERAVVLLLGHDRVLLDLDLEVEQAADGLLLDPVHHVVEHVVALP